MVIHGANDPRVPVGEAEQVVAALQARGAPGRVPALRGRGPRHRAPAQPARLLPARGGVPAAASARTRPATLRRCASRPIWRRRARASQARVCARRCGAATRLDAACGARALAEARAAAAHRLVQAARRDERRARAARRARRGVVAVSSGNHAQAVAYAGRARPACRSTVVMNADANAAKRRGDARATARGRCRRAWIRATARSSRASSRERAGWRSCTRSTTGT